jgi:hypothetical protein
MTSLHRDTTSQSRGLERPRFALTSRPLQSEGAGNAGRPMRPIAACAMIAVERTRVSQVTPESPGIPRAMVYGLFRALPGDRAFLPPSPALLSANLTPASGRQDHTSSPSASGALVSSTISVHRIPPPTSVTIAKRPSEEAGRQIHITDLGQVASVVSEIPNKFDMSVFGVRMEVIGLRSK